ncbi:exported hypothetical protein [Candidatus Sulfopaludibacter sp. SbA4]|nr:exported hypothetical protein [Candidatus Sulfopaludibacter sp. SbA4]
MTMASLPLVSCFCMAALLGASGGGREAQYGDSAGLGTHEETDAAPGAAGAQVFGGMVAVAVQGMVAVAVQVVRQAQDLGRAGFYAEAAALAFFGVHPDRTTVWFAVCCHDVSSSDGG